MFGAVGTVRTGSTWTPRGTGTWVRSRSGTAPTGSGSGGKSLEADTAAAQRADHLDQVGQGPGGIEVGRGHTGDCRRNYGAYGIDRHAGFATRFQRLPDRDRSARRTEVDHVVNRSILGRLRSGHRQ